MEAVAVRENVTSSFKERALFLENLNNMKIKLFINIESLYDYFNNAKSIQKIVSYILSTNFLFVRFYTFRNLAGYSIEKSYISKHSYKENEICFVKNYRYKTIDFNLYYVADCYLDNGVLCDIKNVNSSYRKKNIEIMRIVSFLYNTDTSCVFCDKSLDDCDVVFIKKNSAKYNIESFLRDVYYQIKKMSDFYCYKIKYNNKVVCDDKDTLVFTNPYTLSCFKCNHSVIFNSYLVKDVGSLSYTDVISSNFFDACDSKIILPAISTVTDFNKSAVLLSLIQDNKKIRII
jgi:hypothetical protein